MPEAFDHATFLSHLTTQAGVYQMYDAAGLILYVGKAKNLKNRVSSYFQKTGHTVKTQVLVKRIASITITVTPSEAEALVLEQNLIKAQRPPFNVMLRDDKSYPYIFLSQGEPYPRLAFHRGAKKQPGDYFGPFPSGLAVRDSLLFIARTFGVRQCEDSVFKNRTRPCLQYQIGRCSGPCVGLISPKDYAQDVHHTQQFLRGDDRVLQAELVADMEAAAERLAFEEAAAIRDKITALRQVQSSSSVEGGQGNVDVVAIAREAGECCIHALYVRQGRILGSKSFYPKDQLDEGESHLLEQFLAQQYLSLRGMDLPDAVVLSHPIDGETGLIEAVRSLRGKTLSLHLRVRAMRAKWLALAQEAAAQNLKMRAASSASALRKLQALQNAIGLAELPNRMECFDISHSSGEATRASCVVFLEGRAHKADYRRFSIDGITPGDDYAAMAQALERRYSRQQAEDKPLPDLLIVDGGKGQLSQAMEVIAKLGLDVPMLGIAKGTTRKAGFETLIHPDGREQTLQDDHPGLHLLQQIRDEAHRFAITGHKNARDKIRRQSRLEDIPGIGPKRRRELLAYFGGLQEVLGANPEDLARVPGFSKKLAQEVYTALHCE
ncbi:MAG TPA: excinuclease ABC subunit UvrC [Cellvibrionaceae bacterium]|nr:excinuclease ABC subunit UvrC [Cellvibrionaceae bacterium]